MLNPLHVAWQELGNAEKPLGSNLGARIRKYKEMTWFNPDLPWPWCVAFWQWIIWQIFGGRTRKGKKLKFPLGTASVSELASYARSKGLTTTTPEEGDAACIGQGVHVTFLYAWGEGGSFVGLGGNQAHRVQLSNYNKDSVTTWISTKKVLAFMADYYNLDLSEERPPIFEVVKGEGGQRKIVFTGRKVPALRRVRRLIEAGANKVTMRRKK